MIQDAPLPNLILAVRTETATLAKVSIAPVFVSDSWASLFYFVCQAVAPPLIVIFQTANFICSKRYSALQYVLPLLDHLFSHYKSPTALFDNASPHLWNQLPSSFSQHHPVHRSPGSPHFFHASHHRSPHLSCHYLSLPPSLGLLLQT